MGEPKQNINTRGKAENTYDAIVIGSGISGGWAAKELCEKGLKTIVLERGRNVEHIKDYPTAMKHPWEFESRLQKTRQDEEENPIQSSSYNEATKHFYVKDKEHPYIQDKPFHWIRGYQVGGRSLVWGRQSYRISDIDFEANLKEGIAVDWPIRYKDLAPWYDHVERFAGISGSPEGLKQLPDGEFQPAMEMNILEKHFRTEVGRHFGNRCVTIGRTANLTQALHGRGPCQYRNLCSRGCPFSGYFSSNSATLPSAAVTGNLTIKPHAIVSEILYDPETKKAKGVRVIDSLTHKTFEFFASIIFLNASTIASASILLNSTSPYFPDGLGNSSGQVGHNLMDHHHRVGAVGVHEGFKEYYYSGRRPNGIYIPRFRNIDEQSKRTDYLRGFAFQADAERMSWQDGMNKINGFGEDFKDQLTTPGPWTMWMGAWGETLPNFNNEVKLSGKEKDKWGLPLVEISFEFGDNENAMRNDMEESAVEMLKAAGFSEVEGYNYKTVGGACVHEMGTIRMGNDPKTSVLNKWNQMHDVKNVFVTDGSCMTSSPCQSPSLTYMALTARACDYAVKQLKAGNL